MQILFSLLSAYFSIFDYTNLIACHDVSHHTLPSPSERSSKEDFRGYLDGVLPILDQFIRTYEGNVDNDFWDTVFDYTKVEMVGFSG